MGLQNPPKMVTVYNTWHISKIYNFLKNRTVFRNDKYGHGPEEHYVRYMPLIVCLFTVGIWNYGIAKINIKLKSNCFQEPQVQT